MKSIILSVRPPWARLLVTGQKTIEIRKRGLPEQGEGEDANPYWVHPLRAQIYETKNGDGRGLLIGEVCFWSSGWLHRYSPALILKRACISIEQLDEYAGRSGHLWAWMVGPGRMGLETAIEYPEPRPLTGRPPQSWRWVTEGEA